MVPKQYNHFIYCQIIIFNPNNRTMKYSITLFLCLYTTLLVAQKKPDCDQTVFNDALLDKMAGEWDMTGTVSERKVAYTFNAQWVLNHQFMEWQITDVLKSPPEYVGKIYVGYNCTSKKYIVHWIDNMGGKFSETLGYGIRKNDTLQLKFDYPETPVINTISYNKANDTWQFHLIVSDKGKKKWVTWSTETMTRKK